ncbi:hypothetical protein [Flavobacterium rivuli]|uniref:hypothetical protein n=1 Tax=Flavobacterium rivuli TaxID=498301 RepID=UPI0003A959DE|nr:hypothetical protein [Flavobacterium rivuli]
MKKSLFVIFLLLSFSCNTSFITATIRNRNVYKTKSNLRVKKIYKIDRPVTDPRDFIISPNGAVNATKKTTVTTTEPAVESPIYLREQLKLRKIVTTSTSTNPPSSVTTTSTTAFMAFNGNSKSKVLVTEYVDISNQSENKFIRYKVLSDEGDFKYIKYYLDANS